ncbi:type II secretion system protein [uncultured Azonexus sp.]|uniref:type II secretion system protein n=1 Tax=uncultured Azonexus sp. TaxID=520307 RepID=UPI00262AD528|nr:type II secretion system protein [uncultured Azonexus sp.]
MQHRQHGFTLIEIAIVLVIIGVLLGGILKGQEMLTQSKIRAVEKELDGVAVAILGYRDRYKALPGDDPLASGRWNGVGDGDADGKIAGNFNSSTGSDESMLGWQHLRLAGLIGGDSSNGKQPLNAAGGITGFQTDLSNNTSTLLHGTVICTTNLAAKIANAIDAQQDDGRPGQGSILGFQQSAVNTPDFNTAITAYTDGAGQYTICRNV